MKKAAGSIAAATVAGTANSYVMTVKGPVRADRLGSVLPHEHILVDFVGADKVGRHRYDSEAVFRRMLPYLEDAARRGFKTFVDCTPNYLGRDAELLRRFSEASRLNIVTNTGLYKEPFLPPYAFAETADQLAERWIKEARNGIDGKRIRPGFIKIAVNPGRLAPVQQKIVRAAARTSKATGFVIACHTGNGPAALETIDILREEDVPLDRYIFVHAEGEADRRYHLDVARAGGWVEYDAVGWRPTADHVGLITAFLADGLIDRLLVSHDAGWYHVGEANGGDVKPFTRLADDLIPALETEGLTSTQRDQILVRNPRKAFSITAQYPLRSPGAPDNWSSL